MLPLATRSTASRHPDRLPDVPMTSTDILTENAAIRLAGGDLVICAADDVSVVLGNEAAVVQSPDH